MLAILAIIAIFIGLQLSQIGNSSFAGSEASSKLDQQVQQLHEQVQQLTAQLDQQRTAPAAQVHPQLHKQVQQLTAQLDQQRTASAAQQQSQATLAAGAVVTVEQVRQLVQEQVEAQLQSFAADNVHHSSVASSFAKTPLVEHILDAEKCVTAIKVAVSPLLTKKAVPSMLSKERKMNIIQRMTQAVLSPQLKGDWVETGTWMGGASLIAAYVQKVAMDEPTCGSVRKRTIWLADSFEGLPPEADEESKIEGYSKSMDPAGSYAFEGGLATVKSLFKKHGFEIDGTGNVPIQFIKGYFNDTLHDSPIEDIAILRLDGDMYASTLQALFALYRRVRIGGDIIVSTPCMYMYTLSSLA